MAEDENKERTLEHTPTWAVAVVCFVLLAISISIELIIHAIGKWFKKRHKITLYEALEKVKEELMLMGFISLLLTVFQDPISNICISKKIGESWLPCSDSKTKGDDRKLMEYFDLTPRRILATKGEDKCVKKGKVAFVSAYGIHQLHIFIFVLAIFHILQCILTLTFGRIKMRRWKAWEDETKTVDYQFSNDPARFRFARDTTFGRRHMGIWNQSPISLWIVSFFRQFFGSISKADYLALRHGFIMTHLGQGMGAEFDFQDYIKRSLEADFKVVVGISPPIWFFAVLLLLTNTHGWYSYYWVPFIPLIIILLVGAKLQMIITEMGLSIHDRGEVIMGAPLVEPGDHLFWFNKPRFLLFLIHLVLFQNAFQLAFFSWSTYEFKMNSCFHKTTTDSVIRLTLGVVIQILCSYVTMPLYALVTQMGSTMRPTIFNNEGLATALKSWHHSAKKRVKRNRHSNSTTPFSSRPSSPTNGMSPVHLLHRHTAGNSDSLQTSPRTSNYENERLDVEGGSIFPINNQTGAHEIQMPVVESFSTGEFPVTTGHEARIGSKEFSFAKRQLG